MSLISQVVDKMTSIKKYFIGSGPRYKVDQYLKILQAFKPPSFKGASYHIIAKDWLLKIEKILYGIICPDNRRVILDTFVLKRRS